MNTQDRVGFALLGTAIWAVGTAVYRAAGSYFFEGAAAGYWLNVIATGGLFATVALGLMRWRKIPQQEWLQAAIWVALPGMLGEIPVLANFAGLMGNMQPETAGRYAAFLFAGYSSLMGAAGLMAASARPQAGASSQTVSGS